MKKIKLIGCALALFMILLCIPNKLVYAENSDFNINRNNVLISYSGIGGNVEIPDGVTTIGSKAFQGAKGITSIKMPNSITEIEDSAFDSCATLEKVVFSSNLKKIGDNAFWGCSALKNFEIPDSVEKIGFGAFSNCDSLDAILIPKSVASVGNYCFGFICVNGTYSPIPEFVIMGEEGSAAQTYAEKHNITFLTKADLTAKLNKLSNSKKGKVNVFWYRNPNVSGYQIQYATNKKFSKAKTVTASTDNSSKTISSMKKGKTYYFRVRGYRTVAGKKYYSNWSTSKSIKIKK